MRLRAFAWLAAVSLAAAACGSDTVVVEAQPLAYGYVAGRTLSYDFTVGVDMSVDADLPFSGQPPGDIALEMSLDGILDYAVAAGPDPGTFEVTVSGRITDVGRFSATVGGDEVTGADRDQLEEAMQAAAPIPSVKMVVDEHGRIVSASVAGQGLPLDVLGGGGFGGLFGSGVTEAGLFGPELPEGAVGVGDVWTTEYHQDVLGIPIDAVTTSEATGAETVDGTPVLVIRSVMTLDPVTMSLTDLLEAVAGMDGDALARYGLSPAAVSGLKDQIVGGEMVLSMAMDPSVTTTWFDFESGVTVKAESAGAGSIAVSLRDPAMGDGMINTVMSFEMAVDLR